MRILLTGGTGFLGTSYLRYIMLNQGCSDLEITIISSGRTKIAFGLPKNVTLMQLDLTQHSSVDAFEGLQFDAVLHFATTSTLGPNFSDFHRFRDINLIDSVVLSIVRKVGAKQLIWASSGAVYGKVENYKQTLEFNSLLLNDLHNVSAYRIGKIQSEYHAAKFAEAHDVKLDIMRLFAFSGIDLPLDAHFALGNFVRDALDGNCINIDGTGLARRSYLDQDDFAEIVQRILQNPPHNFRLLNIGSPEDFSLESVARVVQNSCFDVLGEKPELIIHNKFDDKDNYYVPDIGLLQITFPELYFKSLSSTVNEMIIHAQR